MTLNEHVPNTAAQLTVVVPTGKKEPLEGLQTTAPQLPLVVGEKLTIAPH
ncbi:MAG TPA: hypothetical protein VID27_23410 [Blastocatellia bacterium]